MIERRTWKKTLQALLYLSPALAILIVFNIYPIIKSFLMSLYTRYNYFTDVVYARGIGNYLSIFSDPEFWLSLRNTAIFVVGVVPVSICLSLAVAVLLNQKIRFRGLLRTIYFIPFVTSVVAVSVVWRWIFHSEYGLLNAALGLVGISPIHWLTDPNWALPALIILAIWKSLGYNIVIFLAGLQNIDRNYYMAARIDGASPWRRFIHITVPMLSGTTLFVSIIAMINAFKVFDEIYALFNGYPGPVNSAETIVYYIYNKFYVQNQYGIASAASYILFLIIFVLTLIQLKVGGQKKERKLSKKLEKGRVR